MNATLYNDGLEIHTQFKPFTPIYTEKIISVYILNGLSPSPSVGTKFKPQYLNPINRRYIIYKSINYSVTKIHKGFKNFYERPTNSNTFLKSNPIKKWIAFSNKLGQYQWGNG